MARGGGRALWSAVVHDMYRRVCFSPKVKRCRKFNVLPPPTPPTHDVSYSLAGRTSSFYMAKPAPLTARLNAPPIASVHVLYPNTHRRHRPLFSPFEIRGVWDMPPHYFDGGWTVRRRLLHPSPARCLHAVPGDTHRNTRKQASDRENGESERRERSGRRCPAQDNRALAYPAGWEHSPAQHPRRALVSLGGP